MHALAKEALIEGDAQLPKKGSGDGMEMKMKIGNPLTFEFLQVPKIV